MFTRKYEDVGAIKGLI